MFSMFSEKHLICVKNSFSVTMATQMPFYFRDLLKIIGSIMNFPQCNSYQNYDISFEINVITRNFHISPIFAQN